MVWGIGGGEGPSRNPALGVDETILGISLSGANTRRVKIALRPLLRGAPLSKSTVSRLIVRLKDDFEAWPGRSLAEEPRLYVYLDAVAVNVRAAGRVVSTPVLVGIGVRATGEKVLLTLALRGSESQEAWQGVLADLVARGLRRPTLVIADGHSGLRAAIEALWGGVDVQRCTVHKLRNLLAHAPKHAHEALREDFRAIIAADSLADTQAAYARFQRRWRSRCEGVVQSLLEAGEDLLPVSRYPESPWKALRTTNIIERVPEEFRRRLKTQASLPSAGAVLVVLFGLLASGQLRLRRLAGWQALPQVLGSSPGLAA